MQPGTSPASATCPRTTTPQPRARTWPTVQKTPNMAHSTAAGMSASSNTSIALLPPSSMVAGRRLAAAAAYTRRPVAVLPVKATLARPGWALRRSVWQGGGDETEGRNERRTAPHGCFQLGAAPAPTHLSGAPASAPVPVTTLSTPAGRPTSAAIAASSRQVREAASEGLSTAQLPAASAGATFQVAMSSG